MWNVEGNFGALPNPPHSWSKARARVCTDVFICSTVGRSPAGFRSAVFSIASSGASVFCCEVVGLVRMRRRSRRAA